MSFVALDNFCGSQFWDSNQTWNTDSPQLSDCFEQTVLLWIPCLFLWTFSLYELWRISSSKYRTIPWNWFSRTKTVTCLVLLALSISDLLYAWIFHPRKYATYPVDYSVPIIKLFTFGLVLYFIVQHRSKGIRTSGILFFFWLSLALCSIPRYITFLTSAFNRDQKEELYPYISFIIYYPIVLLQFMLCCFADATPKFSQFPPTKNPPPEIKVSFISDLLVLWFDFFAIKAYRRPLVRSDLWNATYEDSPEYLVSLFDRYWEKPKRKSKKSSFSEIKSTFTRNGYTKLPNTSDFSVIGTLWKCFGTSYISFSLIKAISDMMMYISPVILSWLISFEEGDDPIWRGYMFAVLLFIVGVVQMIIINNYGYCAYKLGTRIRTLLISVLYRKSLRVSNDARGQFTLGQVTNLMSVDVQRYYDVLLYLNMAISAPYQIGIALYFLWMVLGESVLAGLAVLLIMVPINGVAASWVRYLQTKQMKKKDDRVKITNEVLAGIKVLKMYAWEESFQNQIMEMRQEEIAILKRISYINTTISFIWAGAPFWVSLVTFAAYLWSDPNNVLNAEKAFVSLSLFNVIRLPISLIPKIITNLTQATVSTKRISNFLNCEELDMEAVTHRQEETDPLVMENGMFSWGRNERAVLRNINVRIKEGSLVAVVGPVGAGKSSLISAFLGEMNKISGFVNTKGKIAYVPQQAWIRNVTLRDNVTFVTSYNEQIYNKVIDACALRTDLQMLPAGDATEIGEKGINLSGGQKQRISLARAVYNNSDVYLFDDPLSAVDSHVGKHIFENIIGPFGLLRKKTRLLVTHSVTYLQDVDYIIVMKDGKISESGTYLNLLDKKGDFADFLNNYAQESNDAENEDYKGEIPTGRITRTISEEVSATPNFGSVFMSEPTISEEEPRELLVGERLVEDEYVETGAIKSKAFLDYVKLGGTKLWICCVIFMVGFQGFQVWSNIWLSTWTSDPNTITSNGTQNAALNSYYLDIFATGGILQLISIIIGTLSMYTAAIRATSRTHFTVLKRVLHWPCSVFDVTPIGRILSRFSFDVDTMDNVIPFNINDFFNFGGVVCSTIFVVMYSTPVFIIIVIPLLGFYVFLQRLYVASSRQLKRMESVTRAPIYSHFGETFIGANLLRAFGVQSHFIEESDKRTNENQKCTYPALVAYNWVAIRLGVIGDLIILFAALLAVIERGSVNGAIIGLSVSYTLRITGPLYWFLRMASDVETNIVSVERMRQFEDTVEEIPCYSTEVEVPRNWPSKGVIHFEDFKVRYREGLELVLKGITFTINASEKVGIAGRTGAGKSSMTLSLFRIVEAAGGQIFIDDVDISAVKLQTLRSRLTIIPQDPVLFSGSLRMNLDPFMEHTDDDLWNALHHSHLKEFVRRLPDRLYYVVSENGGNLSVGQRQLICLARALLRKSKILVLDEATAAIDLETDDLIQKTIKKEFKDCTVLTIAHRLNTILDSDRVMVLDKGYIAEFDKPDTLLENKESLFYAMAVDANIITV